MRHEIDATALSAGELGEGFDFVVFNFPHVGSDEGLQNSIRDNQKLVRGFLESAAPLLSPKGEVHLTLLNRWAGERREGGGFGVEGDCKGLYWEG